MKIGTMSALSLTAAAATAPTAVVTQPPVAPIFRVSANGESMDKALADASLVIRRVCASGSYVIVDNRIRPSADGSFYYGPVTAYCTI